jgi:hypothetical protein
MKAPASMVPASKWATVVLSHDVESSSMIVTFAVLSGISASTRLLNTTENASVTSAVMSPLIDTSIVLLVSPGANVSVPDAAT